MLMREFLQVRRTHIVIAAVMMVCLLIPQVANHGSIAPFVLLLPVFLFGLLDVPCLLRAPVYAGPALLPQVPIPNALFRRPPPSLN
jgi:hypothetical protein